MKTYDIHFNDDTASNNLGFDMTMYQCKDWIKCNRGTGYFLDYKGGTVSVVANDGDGEVAYSEDI